MKKPEQNNYNKVLRILSHASLHSLRVGIYPVSVICEAVIMVVFDGVYFFNLELFFFKWDSLVLDWDS